MDLRAENGAVTPVIRTERLTLRPVVAADAPAIVAGVGEWDVAKWLSLVPHPYSIEDAHSFIAEIVPMGGHFWAIDDGSFAGIISITEELGYWLAEDRWGRGYATEAGRAVVAHHFADPAAGEILAGYLVANERSGGVLAKLGFEKTQVRQRYYLARGENLESQGVVLTRERWAALHA